MKIAYIYTSVCEMGGADRILVQKANYFAEKFGYDVYFITDSQASRPFTFPLSKAAHHIDLGINFFREYKYNFFVRFFYYLILMRRYRKTLEKTLMDLRPDITITALGREMDFLMKIKDGSRKVGESHIAKPFCRNFHLLEQCGFPYCLIAHYWRRKQEKSVSQLDALVLLTEHDRQSWAGVKAGVVIPNSVAFYPKESSTLKEKRCIVVGRNTEQKGYDMLIEAWSKVEKKHPDWRLDCFVQGDCTPLKLTADGYGLKQIYFHVPTTNIMDEYLRSSIYVLSSRFEGFGLVLIEAMACGVPCVSFDCPYGPSDIIQSGEDGILVRHLDTNALAEGICRLVENEGERRQMGAAAKRNISRYKEERIMYRWEQLFNNLIANK